MDGADVETARQQLQRLMRDAEADIAEALSNEGWLTVLAPSDRWPGPKPAIAGAAFAATVRCRHRGRCGRRTAQAIRRGAARAVAEDLRILAP